MESRLGTALLRRHDRGVEPTAAGEALLRHLGPLFDLLDRAFADVEAFATGARGHVRLHANISAVAGFLPEALASFLATNPGIEVSLEERFTADILHAVRTGAADLGLSR
jgi:DNA-binding transcriptional LysR family regulator